MTQLLDAIARYTGPVSLKILAAETGLHSSTVFRILGSLVSHGFVERDEGGYRLGRRLLQLGARVRSDVDIRQEALPAMEWLRDQIGESVNLTIREGDEVIYVERSTPKRMMRVEQVIGSRAPLHVTAVGKIMLGFEGADAIRDYARRTGLRPFTPNTIAEAGPLIRAGEAALAVGYAFDDQEAELGVGCIGTLVRDASGAVVAGLSISAPIERRRDEWAALLVEAAGRVSDRLGYRREPAAAH